MSEEMMYIIGQTKERSTDICYNINDPWKHYQVKKAKYAKKTHLLYDSIYTKYAEKDHQYSCVQGIPPVPS